MKISNDKYYTPVNLAKYCVDKTIKTIGYDSITEFIEPSAGQGVFIDYFSKPYRAYDILPEDSRIIKADFLKINIPYKVGRCVIGNPPFGEKNLLALKFFKKSILIADYVAFILPISQWNNNQQMYEFDLIHSEKLGIREYSNHKVHCCFNIYSRPIDGVRDKPISYKLKSVELKEIRKSRKQFLPKDFVYDLGICSWGYIGKEVKYQGQYSQELYIKINNEKYKADILNLLKTANWGEIYPMTTTPRLKQWQVYKYLKEKIPELE